MDGNIKWLVSAGHEMASELKAECGAVDMRSVAKLISDLATQLEVQLVRANALAEDQQKAIESIKQADAAVKLAHEKFSALAAENAGLKAICDDRRRFIMNGVQVGYIKVPAAETDPDLETIRIAISPQKPIPATDAFLAEVLAQGVDAAIEAAKNLVAQEYEYKDFKAAQSDCCMYPGSDLVGKVEMTEWLVDFAAQLRKGGNQ
ncbi:TPA: eae-like domain protein [Escherichia coli]